MAMTARKKRMRGSAFMRKRFEVRGSNEEVRIGRIPAVSQFFIRTSNFELRNSKILGMRDIRSLFADYASYHQTPGNKLFHRLGIPLIMLTLIGMLARAGVGHLNAAVALIVVAEIVEEFVAGSLVVRGIVREQGTNVAHATMVPLTASAARTCSFLHRCTGRSSPPPRCSARRAAP